MLEPGDKAPKLKGTTQDGSTIKLADYINSHRSKLTVSGMQIQAKDQRTLDEVRPLLTAHQEAGERFSAAQHEGQRVLQGD